MRILAALVLVAMISGACGVDGQNDAQADEQEVDTDPTILTTSTTAETPPVAEEPGPPRYQVSGMVWQKDDSPTILCLGMILTSLPPAGCGEPTVPIVGVDWQALGFDEAGGIRHADVTLVGYFDGDEFVLTEAPGPMQRTEPVVNALDQTTVCDPPAGGWAVVDPATTTSEAIDAVRSYGEGQDKFGGMWIDWSTAKGPGVGAMNDPHAALLNLRFTGSLDSHEQAIRSMWGGALCVTDARFTIAELTEFEAVLADEIDVAMSTVHPRLNQLLMHMTRPLDGYHQHELDGRFGEGAVLVTSAFRPVD